MSAIRLPLLFAFAGGCLCNAAVFGLWRAAEGAGDSEQQQRSHNVVELVTAATAAPSVAQPSELVAATAADHGHEAATEAAPTPVASDLDSSGPTPAGSAVSDVLTRLEAAYRERVAARAPAQVSSTQERATATAAAPADGAVAAAETAPAVATQPVAEVIPVIPPAPAATATDPRATAPAALAPQVAAVPAFAPQVAPAALAPQVAAGPAFAAPDAPPPPPSEIHYGDVNQNTYITNIREGDVYLIQMQQVAMLQYMQLLGMSSGLAAPARRGGGAGHQRGALSSGITNPDNPWGFHFAPPNLVR
jgi:hypothetical protein